MKFRFFFVTLALVLGGISACGDGTPEYSASEIASDFRILTSRENALGTLGLKFKVEDHFDEKRPGGFRVECRWDDETLESFEKNRIEADSAQIVRALEEYLESSTHVLSKYGKPFKTTDQDWRFAKKAEIQLKAELCRRTRETLNNS